MEQSEVDRLIVEYLPLVSKIVGSTVKNGLPNHIEWQELQSAGRLGLVEAAQRYDPSRGVPFNLFV